MIYIDIKGSKRGLPDNKKKAQTNKKRNRERLGLVYIEGGGSLLDYNYVTYRYLHVMFLPYNTGYINRVHLFFIQYGNLSVFVY